MLAYAYAYIYACTTELVISTGNSLHKRVSVINYANQNRPDTSQHSRAGILIILSLIHPIDFPPPSKTPQNRKPLRIPRANSKSAHAGITALSTRAPLQKTERVTDYTRRRGERGAARHIYSGCGRAEVPRK